MDGMPIPVPLDRLKSTLLASRDVMRKTMDNSFSTGHIDPRGLTEEHAHEVEPSMEPMNYSAEMVQNSRLPQVVKEAMLKNPITQINPNKFSLDDEPEMLEKPMGLPKTPKTNYKAPVNEQAARQQRPQNSDLLSVSREELNEMVAGMVNERLLEFFTKSYNKSITENTVKTTINMLIKEGKLTPKKKTL